jgi:signal transduction histidine kinase
MESNIYAPESWNRLQIVVEKTLTTGAPYQLELELIRPDGHNRWANAFGGPTYDNHGKVVGLHGTLQDITDRKIAEEARRHLEERLKRAEKMEALGTLAGGVAHDLNNVLGIIVGYSEMVLDGTEKSKPNRKP